MHVSAKRGLAIAYRPSVRLSVTLVDCDHISWKSWKLIARTILDHATSSLFVAKRRSPTPRETCWNFGETRGGVEKSGMLENKSGRGNIYEKRKDKGKVIMNGL